VNCARHRNPREKLIGQDNACVFSYSSVRTGYTVHIRYVRANKTTFFLYQPSATMAISASSRQYAHKPTKNIYEKC